MKRRLFVLFTLAAIAGLPGCEIWPRHGDVHVRDRNYDVRVVFSDVDRRIIRDYYVTDYRRLPPGQVKHGRLPPGQAYKMKRQQGIPPGISWGYLPPTVESRLSRLPEGYVRVVIGADVAILNTRTRVVVDLIESIHD
ncbi:MAG: hypothetical protein R6W97_06910 [Thiobacillus sp.]